MTETALIDGDVIVYAAGFSSDSTAQQCDFAPSNNEPLAYCLMRVSGMIEGILDATGLNKYRLFLSGPTNFRADVLPTYKQNRKCAQKPFWYEDIRKHLVKEYGAQVSKHKEADDDLGIAQTRDTVICTIDKDLDNVPGLHYNWSPSRKDNGLYMVSRNQALRNFYTQILTGDAVDNIPGLKRITGKNSKAAFKEPIKDMDNERDMFNHVLDVYKECGCTDFRKVAASASCLWIMQAPAGEMWGERMETKKLLKERGITRWVN